MRIAVGSDPRSSGLRHKVIVFLKHLGLEVIDVGTDSNNGKDIPDIAAEVARQVSRHAVQRGILISPTGVGMAIVANKFPGVRAAPCRDLFTVELGRRHNDLNVLCLPADFLTESMTERLVDVWLNTEFEGGRHARRLSKIARIEVPYRHC